MTKQTDKATVAKLKGLQQEVTSMRSTAAQLSANGEQQNRNPVVNRGSRCWLLAVPPIDWAYWEKQLRTPGTVAKIKAEYESKKFAEPKAIDLAKFNAYWSKKVCVACVPSAVCSVSMCGALVPGLLQRRLRAPVLAPCMP